MGDRWLIRSRPRQAYARPFLLRAGASGLAPAQVAIGTCARVGGREIMSDDDRVLLAVTLETGDTLALTDRVAGCLVPQYGQGCWRLDSLTADDVLAHPGEPGVLGLRLGRDPLWLRPRLPALLQRLVENRRPLAAPLRQRATPFLFPGLGRPADGLGRVACPSAQAGDPQCPHRSQRCLAVAGRVRALEDAGDLPGVAGTTASAWHKENGGDRASYVASSLRPTRAPGNRWHPPLRWLSSPQGPAERGHPVSIHRPDPVIIGL